MLENKLKLKINILDEKSTFTNNLYDFLPLKEGLQVPNLQQYYRYADNKWKETQPEHGIIGGFIVLLQFLLPGEN